MDENIVKVSIITVCLNCQDSIENTITSVINQRYKNIQYIVIDGGSTDNTLPVIYKHKDSIDLVISEKDCGIYDAMNKGLAYATGDIIHFLNSGDYFYDSDVIQKIVEVFLMNPEISLVHGDTIEYGGSSEVYRIMKRSNLLSYLNWGICHQSLFARRSVFNKTGKFNVKYQIFGDLDWLLTSIIKNKERIEYIHIPINYYLTGGHSGTYNALFFQEKLKFSIHFALNKEVIILFVKHPMELFYFFGILWYSVLNIILIRLFNKKIILRLNKLR